MRMTQSKKNRIRRAWLLLSLLAMAAGCSINGKAVSDDADAGVGGDSTDSSTLIDTTDTDVDTDTDSGAEPTETDSEPIHSVCPSLDAYVSYRQGTLDDIEQEASGITWRPDTNMFFIVANLTEHLWEYDGALNTLQRELGLVNMDFDTEGIVYLGNDRFAIATESNTVYVVRIDEETTVVDGAAATTEIYIPAGPPPRYNAGFEGIAYAPGTAGAGILFVVQEYSPMRLLSFPYADSQPPYEERSALDGTLIVSEPWDADTILDGVVTDLAGVAYDTSNETLLMLSQESSRLMRVSPDTGEVRESRALPESSAFEGVSLFDDCRIAVLAEPNFFSLYRPE